VIDIRIRTAQKPSPPSWVETEVLRHVLVNFLLQVHSRAAVGADNFVRAYAGVRGHIAAGIRNADVSGFVTNNVVSALDRCSNQVLQKFTAARFRI
jgi:hypothetical protein